MAVPYVRVKDSVFRGIGSEQGLLLSIVQDLYPGDAALTMADVVNVILRNTFASGMHNDLGVLVRGRLIILIEAQSTWSLKIGLRILLYLFLYYLTYVKQSGIDLFDNKDYLLPLPDLYVIYTGKKNVPDCIPLRSLFIGAPENFLGDAKVKVLHGTEGNSVIDQYCRFCEVYDAKWQEHMASCREESENLDDDQKKELYRKTLLQIAEEAIRQCLNEGILLEFLRAHQMRC